MNKLLLLWVLITLGAPLAAQEQGAVPKEKVLGIGGIFFRSKSPGELARWYQKNLGVTLTPTSYEQQPWMQEAGPTVWGAFNDSTKYFPLEKRWMVNFRVRDLAAMAAQLRANGIEVKVDPELYPNGRFARLYDPEGNPIELWEPKTP